MISPKPMAGTLPVPRISGGCTQSHCFFICRRMPLAMMIRTGRAMMKLPQ